MSRQLTGFLLLVTLLAAPLQADDQASEQEATSAKIAALINQLGAPQYATRERAADELAAIGLPAFDALQEATAHRDIEIAERARYLLGSMKVVWEQPSDPPEVKRILSDYGAHPTTERLSRAGQLAQAKDGGGVPALCRIVRYDLSSDVARRAALLIMTNSDLASPEQRPGLKRAVEEQIAESNRTAADWLRAYVQTLEDPPAMVDEWQRLIAAERRRYDEMPGTSAEQASRKAQARPFLRDLYRWQAAYLQSIDRQDDAIAAIRETIALSDGSESELQDIVEWVMERKAWTMIDELAEKHAEAFAANSLFLYRLAESQWQRGDKEEAEATAARALALDPAVPQKHYVVAYGLQERGRLAWAEREYRYCIDNVPLEDEIGIESRAQLAEMLHDQARDDAAFQALEPLIKAYEENPAFNPRSARDGSEVRSRAYFFQASHLLTQGENGQAKEALEKGAAANSFDADLLICMYRLPDADKAWQQQTNDLIDLAATKFKTDIETKQQEIELVEDDPRRLELTRFWQAVYCNQYAWLVGNTRGDVQEAIRMSQLSLEHRPDHAGYLDTLAHCYYRAGDYENAVKHQSRAHELDPHSGQIERALRRFEKALLEKAKK